MSHDTRNPYKIAGPATWELIRAAYLAGTSAPALAERFHVSVHAIRKRITVEKWTKRAYAEALEARGLPPPEKAPKLNVAEQVAEHVARHGVEPAPEQSTEAAHSFVDLVEALKEASALVREREAQAHGSGGEAASAADLEQSALAQLREALARGRTGDAKALAGLAEQMRKRATEEREAQAAQEEAVQLDAAQRDEIMMQLFGQAAYLAHAMLHNPGSGPAYFMRMIKRWREINLGEGEADAEAKAAKLTASYQHFLDGTWPEATPEDVRAYLMARWEEQRERY